MTIPWLMNCPHGDEGWCLECVRQMGEELAHLKNVRRQTDALRHAMSFSPGDAVRVDSARYHGPGIIARPQREESHIIWYDHMGIGLGVRIPNDNIWVYPAPDVTIATDAA